MTRKRRRLLTLALAMTALGGSAALVLNALNDTLVFFYSPSEAADVAIAPGQTIRLGGLVEEGSVSHSADSLEVRFVITDGARGVEVAFAGLLPDLFREGQGVVVDGAFDPAGQFRAHEVLAKHDENYMPKEVAEALREAGTWRGDPE